MAPSPPTTTSLRNVAFWAARLTLLISAPVRRLNSRNASMSATNNVSPFTAIPLGALSVTPFFPASASIVTTLVLSARTRAMNPLLSFWEGFPLTLLT